MRYLIIALCMLAPISFASADQPIFNEMPRWSGGYGVQVLQVYRIADALQYSGETTSNTYHYTRVEGVYTWKNWVRATAKIRVLNHRTIDDAVSNDSGPTDLRLAVPLKSYFNLDGRTGSYTLTPEFTLPLTDQNHGQLFIGSRRYGLSVGYDTESYYYHFGGSVAVRKQEGRKDPQYEANLGIGLNGFAIGFSGHLKLEAHYNDMGGGHHIVRTGPTLYGQVNDTWHWQAKWHASVYEVHRDFGVLDDQFVSVGVAVVQ